MSTQTIEDRFKTRVEDIKESGRVLFNRSKDHVFSSAATILLDVRKSGGLTAVGKGVAKDLVCDIGTLVGHAGKHAHAGYQSATIHDEDIDDGIAGEKARRGLNPNYIDVQVEAAFDAFRLRYNKHLADSPLDPQDVSEMFERTARKGYGVLQALWSKIKSAKDAFSKELEPYIPSPEDYVVELSTRSISISEDLFYTKQEVTKVREFLVDVDDALPANFRNRNGILQTVADKGIISMDDMKEKTPSSYDQILPKMEAYKQAEDS